MTYPSDAPPLTDAEQRWPMAGWLLYRGRVLDIGEGLRIGLVRVRDDESARVQVFSTTAPEEAEGVTLRLGYPVDCKGRAVRLLEIDRSRDTPAIRVTVG